MEIPDNYKDMKKKTRVDFVSVKVIGKPVKIEFHTKKGEKVFFKGIEGVEVFDPEHLEAKDLVRWLNKKGFKSLAKALKRILKDGTT